MVRRGRHERKVEVRSTIPRFLIVCEGEKTEPNYFRGFRHSRVQVNVLGTGYNTVSLVNKAKEEVEALKYQVGDEEDDDQVWCVFDRDSFRKAQFNEAIRLAGSYGYHVAYSNQAFELWYLLHFNYYDAALYRGQYIGKLTELLGRRYEKNSAEMYDLLYSKQQQAMQNARRLYDANHSDSPANDNPSTTVFLLVEALRQFVR